MAERTVRVEVDVNIDFAKMAHWPPENVRAFMDGLAKVVTAHQAATPRTPTPEAGDGPGTIPTKE
jgi:hypothetical protein